MYSLLQLFVFDTNSGFLYKCGLTKLLTKGLTKLLALDHQTYMDTIGETPNLTEI